MMACNKYSSLGYEEKPSLFLEFHGSEQHTQEQAQIVGKSSPGLNLVADQMGCAPRMSRGNTNYINTLRTS